MLPKSQSLESLLVLFVTTTYYYCCYCLCVCVCVYPCKQFVVVTIRRTGSWNTIPTLPYLTLLTFFYRILTRSTGIHHRFIVWFLERTIILEDEKSPSRNKFQNLPENSLESITIQSSSSKYSRRALERHSLWWWWLLWLLLLSEKQRPIQTEYINLQGEVHFFTIKTSHQYQEEEEGEDKKTTTTSTSKP